MIRVCENGRACEWRGFEKSSTVSCMALVISSLDVYGKHMLRTALHIVSFNVIKEF